MKNTLNILLFLVASLSASNICKAQNSINYGLLFGGNAATLFGDTYSDIGMRFGPLVGFYLSKKQNDDWSFETGLYYSQEGARNGNYDFSNFSTVVYKQTLAYDYLAIPLLAKKKQSDKLEWIAGPRVGLRLRAEEVRKIKSGEPSPSDKSAGTRDISKRIKLIYPGVMVGGIYSVQPGVNVQVSLYSSFFDTVKKDAGDSEGTYPIIVQIGLRKNLAASK